MNNIKCRELDNKRQANYCLSKAITADPEDINLQFHRASIYVELGEYHKAAESYEQISRLCPDNIEVLKTATQVHLPPFLVPPSPFPKRSYLLPFFECIFVIIVHALTYSTLIYS